MDKFFDWMNRNRKEIGYTIGGLNMLASLSYAVQGQVNFALIYFTLGAVLIFDSYDVKD